MSKENRKEIKGIDPKSYGDFDKFMDRAQKITKYIFPVLGASLTAGCTVEIINTITKTAETPELSPLSPDLTKTPTLSPTDVNYELTPTVQNSATEELTLVPPTEVATDIPIITLAPEPTATATEMSTPTEIPEKYPIDLEKLSTTPESYEYLLDHKDEFVKGPDPLEVGMEEFFKWYSEKLIPSLGDYNERDGNLCYNKVAVGEELMNVSNCDLDSLFKGQMEFWYFEHGEIVYPVLEIAGIKDGRIGYNIGVVLVEGIGSQGLGAIKDVKDGQKKFSNIYISTKDNKAMPVSGDVHRMLKEGFFYYNGKEHYLGIGVINFFEP